MSKVSHDSETPAVGQQVITACAVIHKDIAGVPHILLARRAATKKFLPDVFEFPGGHIDYGEDIVEGLIREIHEEFGVTVEVGSPFAAFTYLNEVKGSHSVEVVYFAELIDESQVIITNPEDHSEYRWFNKDTISDAYTTNKNQDDIEMKAALEALNLLAGAAPKFR